MQRENLFETRFAHSEAASAVDVICWFDENTTTYGALLKDTICIVRGCATTQSKTPTCRPGHHHMLQHTRIGVLLLCQTTSVAVGRQSQEAKTNYQPKQKNGWYTEALISLHGRLPVEKGYGEKQGKYKRWPESRCNTACCLNSSGRTVYHPF